MQGELPVMQYKIHPKSPDWMPRESGIEIWKKDDQGKPKLPPSCPNVVPIAEYVRDSPLVIQGIKAYLEFWKKCSAMKGKDHDATKYMEPIILYWQNMISELEKPTNNHICQYIGFWPKTTGSHRMQEIEEDRDEFQGFEEFNDHFVGTQSARPQEAFKPQIDVKKDDFVLVRPADPQYPIWLGVAESDVDLDFSSPNHKKVFIQYWAPKHRKRNPTIHEQYEDCWKKTWCCNLADPKRWECVDAVVWSWTPRGGKVAEAIKIPPIVVEKAQASLLGENE